MPRPKKEAPNRKDGLYEVKITIGKRIDGKLIRKSFYSHTSKDDARKQAERWRIEQAVAEQTGAAFVERNVTFEQWARKWLKTYKLGKVKGNTYAGTYRIPIENHLIPYFGGASLDDIRPVDIQTFFNEKGETASVESMRKMRTCLAAIFDTAIENNLCRRNPVTKSITLHSAVKGADKRTYTAEQYQIVKAFAQDVGALDILVLLETGISRSELLGLRWEDFDEQNQILYIRQGASQFKDPVTGEWTMAASGLKNAYRERAIPLSADLTERLRAKPKTIYVGRNQHKNKPGLPVNTEYIFHSSTGKLFSPDNWRGRHYDSFMDALVLKHPDIPKLTPHELRHTRATLWKDQGVDLFTISKLLGHSDLDMLAKRYAHNNIETLRKALGYTHPSA